MTIVNDRTITPPIHDPELDRRVKSAGASKTVYALVTPETEAAKNLVLGNAVSGPDAARRRHLEQFRDAWTGKQFAAHEAFIERWMAWAAPVVAIDAAGFPWRYPTAGCSEALFHVIAAYGNRARCEKFNPEVHVFAGEYEGYKAYAEACGIAVIEHSRSQNIQREAASLVGRHLDLTLTPCDVSVLAQAESNSTTDRALADFLRRPANDPNARLRLCLTPAMAELIGTAGPMALPGGAS